MLQYACALIYSIYTTFIWILHGMAEGCMPYDHALLIACLCLRGVAAIAGRVHLMDRKSSQKGGARPCPKHHHPVPQGSPFSIKCWMSTRNQQSVPVKTHSFLKDKMHTRINLCERSNTISLQPHPLQTIVASCPALQSSRSHRHTMLH